MESPVSGRQTWNAASAAVATASAILLGCSGPTAPDEPACSAVPNPGIPLRSGLAGVIPIDLRPGEACAIRADGGGAFRLVASDGGADYLVAVQSASEVAGARTTLRLTIEGEGGPVTARRSGAAASARPQDSSWASDAELRFRRDARRELARVGAAPARSDPTGVGIRLASHARPPSVGDTLVMRSSVDAELSVDCDRTDRIPAVARAVGRHFVLVEDVEAAGHFTSAQYAEILATLDDPLFPVSTAYFGAPADLDGNERVLVFITPIVNRATPRGSTTFIAGFFNPSDLSDSESCPASNSGEVLYVLAPDPAGKFGDPVDVEFAARNVAGITAHEFTHLLNAQQRVTLGGGTFADLEESWLDEGLAHTAEMVVGLAAAGLIPGRNYGLGDLAADPDLFNTFHLANFRRAGYYMLNPGRTLALGDDAGRDPGGQQSLAMRGFSWLLLRWIADQADVAPGGVLGGPDEEALFLDLTTGGPGRARGIQNVERVAGPAVRAASWRDLIARYGLAPLADDATGEPTPDSQVTSLHLPDIFDGIHRALPDKEPFLEPYPLQPEVVDVGRSGGAFTFELFASASDYVVLTSAEAHGSVRLTLTTGTGGRISSTVQPQIVIQRTR